MCLRKENSTLVVFIQKKKRFLQNFAEKVIYIAATAKLKKMEKEKNI